MYRHLLVFTAAGSLQPSCVPYAKAFALGREFTLARREMANEAIHETFFIPTVVASGVVFLLGILCVLMILLTSSTPNRPPLPQTHEIDHDQPPRPLPELPPNLRPRSAYLSRANTASNTSASGSFYYNEPPSNKVQRKPPPIFQPSPNRTPPGTASMANYTPGPSRGPGPGPGPPSSAYVHPLRPGVPQHPSLAKYNPEPLTLIYERKSPDVGEATTNPEKMVYQWTHPQTQPQPQPPPGPPMPVSMSMPMPIPASLSSLTRVGSGPGASDQQQQQHVLTADQRPKPSGHPPSAQNPPSPPPTPPQSQIQTHQKTNQRQSRLTTAAATHETGPSVGSYGSSMDHRDAYGGIETDEEGVRRDLSSTGQGHTPSQMARPPPGYAESGPYQRDYPPEKAVLRGS